MPAFWRAWTAPTLGLAAAFPDVWRISALRFNDILIGLETPLPRSRLISRLEQIPHPLRTLVRVVEPALRRLVPTGAPWTDDHAPVEWVTDQMLAEQITRGEGLDERLLPTKPR